MNVHLLPHDYQEQARCFGELYRETCNTSLKLLAQSLGGVIPNNSNGDKQWYLACGIGRGGEEGKKREKKKRTREKDVIDVRKHRIKTDLLSSPHSAHLLL